jgi:ribosomal protein S18 acetylase RimI-like enzyme
VPTDQPSRDDLVEDVATVLHSLSPEDLRLRFGRGAGGDNWLLDDLRTHRAHRAYVARDGAVPIAVLDTVDEKAGTEFGLIVSPGYRRRGVAKKLLGEMFERAKQEHGTPQRFLGLCLPENRAAAAMLRAAGFAPAGRYSEYLRFERIA